MNADAQSARGDGVPFRPSEMLRLNMSIAPTAEPNRLGVLAGDLAGFPNGRRLSDDVVDIAVQAVEGAAMSGQLVDELATIASVDRNDRDFGSTFPYLALPHDGNVNEANDEAREIWMGTIEGLVGRDWITSEEANVRLLGLLRSLQS